MKSSRFIKFLGFVTDEEKWELYRRCRALIYPVKDEDFGIVPVEANAVGTPVIAFLGGCVKETVIENKTGLFFKEHNVEALVEQIRFFESVKIDPATCRCQVFKFSHEVFNKKIQNTIDSLHQEGDSPFR